MTIGVRSSEHTCTRLLLPEQYVFSPLPANNNNIIGSYNFYFYSFTDGKSRPEQRQRYKHAKRLYRAPKVEEYA